ncbi:DHA2 family efflux MFS transporter permease subunit [Nocardia sp. NPDC127526]|uniref:DHA2 family efflux MFS transporter permease subunit n=1 Tax=Nocardia sp. NPDC127526 TaxID=3345393 RepID=UPI003645332D
MTTISAPAPEVTTTGRPAPSVNAIAAVVIAAGIMSVLDTTVVNVALNQLAASFHVPLSTIAWVSTAYLLALATVIPLTAWAMGRFGAKRTFLTAIILFTLGSLLAGLAWNAPSLIAFRVLQGLGGGLLMPVGMSMVMRAADPKHMGRTTALLGIPVLVGPLAGPILGGWLVDNAGWRWAFFINLPIAAVALIGAVRVLADEQPQPGRRLDLPGLLMLSPGLALLIYGVATGGEHADFTRPSILAPTLAGLALVIAFVLRALRIQNPLLDLNLFRHRAFRSAAATLTLFNGAYFGSMLLGPLYWQLVRDTTATEAGLLGIPQVLATGITMQVAGRLIDRIPPGRIVLGGISLAAFGFGLITTQIHADSPYWAVSLAGAVMGVGVGATIMPTMTTAARTLPKDEMPAANTTLSIISQVASSVGIAAISVLLTTAMAREVPGATLDSVARTVERAAIAEPLADAFRGTYGWAVLVLALAIVPALLLPRKALS